MKKLLLSLLLCTVLVARPQTIGNWPGLYPEDLQEDLDILFTTLRDCHPDLYRYAGEIRLERVMDSIAKAMDQPQEEEQVMLALQHLLRTIGDPNLKLLPSDEKQAQIRESELMLPINVKVYEEGLFVEDELKGHQSVPPGSRIFFINGLSDDEIMERLLAQVVAEGNNVTLKYRMIDEHFPALYHQFIGPADEYTVMYESPDGDLHSCTMHGLTQVEMELSAPDALERDLSISYRFDEASASGYLRVPSFDPSVHKTNNQNADKLYRQFFSKMDDLEYKMAIIDLRGNAGGTSFHAEQLYACFADRTFRADRDIWVASTDKPVYYDYTSQPDKFYKDLNIDYTKNLVGRYSINPDHFALNYAEPKKDAYQGRVYILIDGGTRNSGAIPAILAKAHNRAVLIGEESGSNVFAATGGERLLLTLPNTGIKMEIPLQKLLYDVDIQQSANNGVEVDQRIEQHPYDLAKGVDTMYEAVRRLMMEYR